MGRTLIITMLSRKGDNVDLCRKKVGERDFQGQWLSPSPSLLSYFPCSLLPSFFPSSPSLLPFFQSKEKQPRREEHFPHEKKVLQAVHFAWEGIACGWVFCLPGRQPSAVAERAVCVEIRLCTTLRYSVLYKAMVFWAVLCLGKLHFTSSF